MTARAFPLSKAWTNYRQYGPAETLCKALHRAQLVSVKHSLDVFFKDLPASVDVEPGAFSQRVVCAGHELVLREIHAAGLRQLRFAPGLQYAADRSIVDDIQKQFSNGLRYFAAFNAGTVVAVNSIHPRMAHLDYLRKPPVMLPPGVVYLNGAFTAPAYRRRKIGNVLRDYTLTTMRAEGFQRVMLMTYSEELDAVRWHLASGFLRWGRVTYLRCGSRNIWWTRVTRAGRRHRFLLNLDGGKTS